MPKVTIFAMYCIVSERITCTLFMKIVNNLEEKNVFRRRQFQSFDGGSVRIKGVKTLYFPVVHSKHTASYTG